jgi:hypothetical protein
MEVTYETGDSIAIALDRIRVPNRPPDLTVVAQPRSLSMEQVETSGTSRRLSDDPLYTFLSPNQLLQPRKRHAIDEVSPAD